MKNVVVLSFLIAAAAADALGNSMITTIEELVINSTTRIISGRPAAPGQFPHQVLNIHTKGGGQYTCGGSLICDSWVLTAAHCAAGASRFSLSFGATNQYQHFEPGRVQIHTYRAYVHPGYNPTTLQNDVALIYLGQRLYFTNRIQPIALGTSFIPPNYVLTVSGWGRTSDASNAVSPYLNYVQLISISNYDCLRYYGPQAVTASVLCCRGNPQHSTCNGDSGGPLIQYVNGRPVQVGVVSFVPKAGCGIRGPSGYARVASYLNWIIRTINGSCRLTTV